MKRSLELAVREQLADYLADEITIDDLKSWLVASTWSSTPVKSTPGLQIANEIKLAFAEHSGGFRSDEELRESLVAIHDRIEVEAVISG